MSDSAFEQRLARLFAEPPALPDQPAFTQAVQARLERGWRMRRVLIGAAGSAGGLIAAVQILQANLVHRAAEVSHTADDRAHDLLAELAMRMAALMHAHNLPIGGEALWMVAGLGAVGLALAAARLLDQF
jgi:hypothetical protein